MRLWFVVCCGAVGCLFVETVPADERLFGMFWRVEMVFGRGLMIRLCGSSYCQRLRWGVCWVCFT